jgi:HlyD family secretion protein
LVVVVILAIIGFLTINPKQEIVQGEVDANSVRVSGLMPGRVEKFYVTEGQKVHAGDTLAKIHSATVDAKLAQALAMQDAADAQRMKADAGARKQTISAAYDLWQQAKAALEIRKKTYERVESLYKQNVVSEQKRDEAKAAYDAAVASERGRNARTRWLRRQWLRRQEARWLKWSRFCRTSILLPRVMVRLPTFSLMRGSWCR